LYVGGTANFRGDGILNQGVAANFTYFATSPSSEVSLRISTPFVGGIYAPNATCSITSGGGSAAVIQGAIIVGSMVLGTDVNFHFDEALAP
jgi:hypothetical protein